MAAIVKVKNIKENKVTGKDLFEFCQGKIAFYKIPKYVKFVEEYPLTVSGKVQKYIMRN